MPIHTYPSIRATVVTRTEKRAFADRKTMPKVQSDNAMLAYLSRADKKEEAEPGGASKSQDPRVYLAPPDSSLFKRQRQLGDFWGHPKIKPGCNGQGSHG